MSRGFVSKANKEKAAHLEVLRRGYLSAIAWRKASWLAALHVERERARDIVRHLMPANRDQARAEEAEEHERVQNEARACLAAWNPTVSAKLVDLMSHVKRSLA